FNSVPKHVATHRSDSLDWQNSHALEGDLADAIRALKHQDSANLLTWGSGDMLHPLLAAGLVDELRFLIIPSYLGAASACSATIHSGLLGCRLTSAVSCNAMLGRAIVRRLRPARALREGYFSAHPASPPPPSRTPATIDITESRSTIR